MPSIASPRSRTSVKAGKTRARSSRVNVLGTAELLAAARSERGAEAKILVVSSAEVYGVVAARGSSPHREDTPTLPASPYAASKLSGRGGGAAGVAGIWPAGGRRAALGPLGPGQSPNFFVPALAKRIVEARRWRGVSTCRSAR